MNRGGNFPALFHDISAFELFNDPTHFDCYSTILLYYRIFPAF
jgi:hypothetical protein